MGLCTGKFIYLFLMKTCEWMNFTQYQNHLVTYLINIKLFTKLTSIPHVYLISLYFYVLDYTQLMH